MEWCNIAEQGNGAGRGAYVITSCIKGKVVSRIIYEKKIK